MDAKAKYLPEHFEEETEDYYKALEKSNFLYKLEANKFKPYVNDEKYKPFFEYSGPLSNMYIKNDPTSSLANKIYDLETKYLNSKNTRKTPEESKKFDNSKPFVRLNMASLPSSESTKMWYGNPEDNVPKGDGSWVTFKASAQGKSKKSGRVKGKIGRF